jgi:hypothetical protein
MWEIQMESRNFGYLSLKLNSEKKNQAHFGKIWLLIYLLDICYFRFDTGIDWLNTCTISTNTQSVFENWTSTSTSVPKMISGLTHLQFHWSPRFQKYWNENLLVIYKYSTIVLELPMSETNYILEFPAEQGFHSFYHIFVNITTLYRALPGVSMVSLKVF